MTNSTLTINAQYLAKCTELQQARTMAQAAFELGAQAHDIFKAARKLVRQLEGERDILLALAATEPRVFTDEQQGYADAWSGRKNRTQFIENQQRRSDYAMGYRRGEIALSQDADEKRFKNGY